MEIHFLHVLWQNITCWSTWRIQQCRRSLAKENILLYIWSFGDEGHMKEEMQKQSELSVFGVITIYNHGSFQS